MENGFRGLLANGYIAVKINEEVARAIFNKEES